MSPHNSSTVFQSGSQGKNRITTSLVVPALNNALNKANSATRYNTRRHLVLLDTKNSKNSYTQKHNTLSLLPYQQTRQSLDVKNSVETSGREKKAKKLKLNTETSKAFTTYTNYKTYIVLIYKQYLQFFIHQPAPRMNREKLRAPLLPNNRFFWFVVCSGR